MEHAKEGSCAVCGVTTIHRCSPCAEKGFDLFLCDREHQKLIWSVHKRICGINPFRFPLLSPAEYAKAKEWLFLTMVDEGAHNFTLASRLASTFECSHKEVPALLDSLREGSDVYTSHSAAVISEALCVVRSVVQCHKTTLAMQNRRVFNVLGIRFTLGTDIAQRDLELLDPVLKHGHKLRTLGLSMYNDSDGKLPSFPLDEPFYTKLCHHLLVYHTLLFRQVLEAKRGAPTDTLQQYLEVSAKRLQEIFWIAKRKDERLAAPLEEILGRAALEGGVEILMKRS